MDLKQLEAFAQVVRLGSFSRAAEHLFLTQPTVSTHISSLEKEMGSQLIVRGTKEAYPSETGKILYEYTLEILALRDAAVAACKKQASEPGGQIAIAASTIPYTHALPELMSAFRDRYPRAMFSVLSRDSGGVVGAVESGDAELGMTGTVLSSARCVYEKYTDDPLVVVVPNTDYYRALGDDISVPELAEYPFIIREQGSGTRKEAEAFLKAHGLRPESLKVAARLDSPDAIVKSVVQGLGVSILSRLSVSDCERLGQVRICNLEHGTIPRCLYIVRHNKRQLSPIAEAFWQFALLRAGVGQFTDQTL